MEKLVKIEDMNVFDRVLVDSVRQHFTLFDGFTEMLIREWSPTKTYFKVQWRPNDNSTTQWLSVEYFNSTYKIVEILSNPKQELEDKLKEEFKVRLGHERVLSDYQLNFNKENFPLCQE